MLASQLALIVVPGIIFVLLAVLFLYKAVNICYGSSGVAEMRTQARTTHMTHMRTRGTRGTQTRETRGEHDTTVFL